MTKDERPFAVFLDATAIDEFTRESLAVGELMTVIDEEGGLVGLPALCLAEAVARCKDRDLLDLLCMHRAAAIVRPSADWRATAVINDLIGRYELTSAMLDAIDNVGYVVTRHPAAYGELIHNGKIIAI